MLKRGNHWVHDLIIYGSNGDFARVKFRSNNSWINGRNNEMFYVDIQQWTQFPTRSIVNTGKYKLEMFATVDWKPGDLKHVGNKLLLFLIT